MLQKKRWLCCIEKKTPSQSHQPSGEKHKEVLGTDPGQGSQGSSLLYPQDKIPSSRCPHKTRAGNHGRAMSHAENTAPWLCITPRSSRSPGTAVCSMIRWVMKRAEVVEQKGPFGLFQLLSRARSGLTRARWMGTRRSLCATGALPQCSARWQEAVTVSTDKTSSLLQAGHGL